MFGRIIRINRDRFRAIKLPCQLLPRHAAVGALEQDAIAVHQIKVAAAGRQGEHDGIEEVMGRTAGSPGYAGFSCCQVPPASVLV